MNVSRIFLNRLPARLPAVDTVVVIDVLRSFTTAAVALSRDASALIPVEDLSAARGLCAELPQAVSVGAIAGGDPAPGFEYGNSPSALMTAAIAGRPVVLSTAAGVRGLELFRDAPRLYACSLVCACATAQALRSDGTRSVCFVITGEWRDRDGDEDIACADYLEVLLTGRTPDPADYARRVRTSDFGRRFASGKFLHLPVADLDIAAQPNLFDRPMPVQRNGDWLVIR